MFSKEVYFQVPLTLGLYQEICQSLLNIIDYAYFSIMLTNGKGIYLKKNNDA